MGRSVIEVVISVVGQWLACLLIGVGIRDLAFALLPGVRLALLCGLAVVAGKTIASMSGIEGPLMLVMIVMPPALVYAWLESSSALKMISDAFGRSQISPIMAEEAP
jgi:hypothetical protein